LYNILIEFGIPMKLVRLIKCVTYCDVFDRRPSLLGNRTISVDTLTTQVFLRCMVTNSWNASVSIVAGSVKEGKTIYEVRLRRSV
jgi:hypothetical protein